MGGGHEQWTKAVWIIRVDRGRMIIGIPRERKHGEQRVSLTPDGVLDLCADGHELLIE